MKIKEIIIDNERVFLKKGFFGWRVVHPIKKNLEEPFNWKKNVNWLNLLTGGWGNLVTLIIIVGMIVLLIISYKGDISSCNDLLKCGATCPINNFPLTQPPLLIPNA